MSHSIYKNFIFLIVITVSIPFFAQSTSRNIVYNAYLQGDMKKWEQVIMQNNKLSLKTVDEKLELIGYYYGYIGHLLHTKKYETAVKYIEKGEKLIDLVLKQSPKSATAYAYKGSYIGFRISLNKFKSVTLGPESSRNIEFALELDPDNVQAIADKANSLYHTPRLFGGNKAESLRLFQRATFLIEKNNNTEQNWFYVNLLVLTAKNFESLGQLNKARQLYEKILRLYPDFHLVKQELLPAVISKMSS